MNTPETNFRAWIAKAESDLLNINNNLRADDIPWDTVCYHAQQGAEKMLKAFLVFHHRVPERTHNLVALLEKCSRIEPTLQDLDVDCKNLNAYSVDSRYPDAYIEAKEPGEREGRAIADAASRVRLRILSLLPE